MVVGNSLLLLSVLLAASPAETESRIGRQIEVFELKDYLGASHSLDEWKQKKAVVVVFMGTECPLAKLYGTRLAELAQRYAPMGVQFVGINSNQQDTLAEIAHYARVHRVEFPILKDPGNQVADQFRAVRTPEVFVVDDRRVVRYWGAIDDQYGVGYSRAAVQKAYLADAIDELLAGQPITTPVTEAVGCFIGRVVREKPTGDVTYASHIARILNETCVGCHRPGQIAPFSLTSYDEVVGWAETIREVIDDQRMPPWHANPKYGKFRNDARLSDEAKQLIVEWVENGAPEGDPNDAPKTPEFVDGWQIGKPDLVIRMPNKYKVPAKGVVDYQYFYVDPGFKEDVWIRGAEGRPGNRSVVHHMILFFIPPGQDAPRPEDPLVNAVASFSPGQPAMVGPEEYGRCIPAGSKLVFQMHYTPNGSVQLDQSEAGLVLTDPKKVEKEVKLSAAVNFQFKIPAGEPNYRIDARHRFNQDTLLYTLIPHMHLRGKSFRFTAIYPDKSEEILLDVPRYDFNWQNVYQLAEPKLMPEGTELHCIGHFDNSADNLVNPDPTKPVTWGDQTWEEMMVGSFSMSLADLDLSLGPPRTKPLDDGRFEVSFRYRPTIECDAVYLAGEFNEWKPNGHKMDGPDEDGFFKTSLTLEAGRYEYKFVLDGKTWKHDPGNREQAGYFNNSVLWVGARDTVKEDEAKADEPRDKAEAKPKFTISKETTHVTDLLTESGYPDYSAAINRHFGRGVTAENNANVLLWRAHGPHPERATMPGEFFALMGIEAPPEEGDYLISYYDFLREKSGIKAEAPGADAIYDQQQETTSRPWKADDYEHVAAWLRANETPLSVVVEATKRPRYFSPVLSTDGIEGGLISMLLPGVQSTREFARALASRAMLHLGEGRIEEAWQDLLACHRLGRQVGQGVFLVEGLVGIAIDNIATHGDLVFIEHVRPDAEQAARYLRDLDALPPVPNLNESIHLVERYALLDSTFLIARGGERAVSGLLGEEFPQPVAEIPLDSVAWDAALRVGNEWLDRVEEALKEKQYSERSQKLNAIAEELRKDKEEMEHAKSLQELIKGNMKREEAYGRLVGRALCSIMLPAINVARGAADRAEQQQRNLRIAFALAAYERENGKYPVRIDSLVPKYLPRLPNDLFSDEALVYRRNNGGYLLYSVGPNGKDENGNWYGDDPPGDDIRTRMPLEP